ncbi:MAG TPA: UvrD-helicase domain-containing protein, partial [Symbiobacteriaceae bacterium]|nr:UvrD-helicase domain-containing protein [Symbiobacteriaceae bacterium]
MKPTVILGATGSGKTTALMQRYYQLVRSGVRTDQVLVLTAGAAQTSLWRRGLKLEAHGPIEAHSFFGFIQRELNLFWAPVQEAIPALRNWVRPEFLNVEIAHHLMRGLVEPVEIEFGHFVKASPQRIAIQIASNLSTVASASGLTPAEMARRLAQADRQEKTRVYDLIHGLLEVFREQCLLAGILDYGLSLHLFTRVLMEHPDYLQHLRGRYQFLLVDDLDETVAAEQDFLGALALQMDQVVYALGTDGGHSGFMGADPVSARQRFLPGAEVVELSGSYTCSPEAFALGEALALRIGGDRKQVRRFRDMVEDHISADLRGEMITAVVEKIGALVDRGVKPGDIAVITPHVDKALEVTARQVLGARAVPVKVQNVSLSRRLVDEP